MDPITINLVILAASYILSSVLAPKPQKPKPAAFDAADFPLCEEGEDQAVVFGQCWSKSWMVLTVERRRMKAITTKASKK